MLNDSVINFYLNYLLTKHMYDVLSSRKITREDVEKAFSNKRSHAAEQIRKAIAKESRFYIFSTFFYPLLKKLYQLRDRKTKEKVRKWAENGHVFDRDFVLFPIFNLLLIM